MLTYYKTATLHLSKHSLIQCGLCSSKRFSQGPLLTGKQRETNWPPTLIMTLQMMLILQSVTPMMKLATVILEVHN
jgi:hypothetical protein